MCKKSATEKVLGSAPTSCLAISTYGYANVVVLDFRDIERRPPHASLIRCTVAFWYLAGCLNQHWFLAALAEPAKRRRFGADTI